jgi:DNA-binding Lrp family transcriptional regulator
MSVEVFSEVIQHSEAELGTRLVLFVLANHAWSDGVTWISQKDMTHKARMSESSVRRAIRQLEEMGEIETRQAQRGKRRVNVYRIIVGEIRAVEPDYDRMPFELAEPFSATTGQIDRRSDGQVTTGHLRPVNSKKNRKSLSKDQPPLTLLEEDQQESLDGPRGAPVPKSVDQKPVTRGEGTKALAVLAAFNVECGGRPFRSKDHVAKIVMRIREQPALSVEEHHEIIRRNFANPWWKGPPTPSVVYGNGSLFESAMRNTGVREPRTKAERKDARVRKLLHLDGVSSQRDRR